MDDLTLPRYMIATTATHKTGDLSSPSGEIAYLHGRDHETGWYIGQWEEGFGFVQVRFDPAGVRELTEEELADLDTKVFAINNTIYPGSVGERIRKTNGSERT